MTEAHPSFDEQANTFDARKGIPISACRETVEFAMAAAEAGAQDLAVEVGAGTGQIGETFARSSRYCPK